MHEFSQRNATGARTIGNKNSQHGDTTVINLFSHYIPRRSLVLAAMEAIVLLIAAQIGMSVELAGSHR